MPSGRKAPSVTTRCRWGCPVDEAAEGLDGGDDAGDDVGLAEGRAQEVAQGAVGDAAENAEELAVLEEEGPQALGDGEDELAVGEGVEEHVLEPVGPDLEPLGDATPGPTPGRHPGGPTPGSDGHVERQAFEPSESTYGSTYMIREDEETTFW